MNIFTNLRGNIFGGITAGIIALPLALAFGVASGLGASAGLWGAIIVCFFASIFGGTPTQISGPTGPMTVVVAALVLSHPGNVKPVFAAIMIAGVIQILLSFSKIAGFVRYVPYPVISGFMSGIGVIIISLQAAPLLGIVAKGSPIAQIIEVIKNLANINPQALFLGLLALAILFFTPKKAAKTFPPALTALIIGTITSVLLNLNVQTIGAITATIPKFQIDLITLNNLNMILPMALTLAVLGSIDSLLTSLVADSVTNTKHNSDKELFGQGLGNMFAGLFGGLAGAGATMRTLINIKSGGTTAFSGVVHSIFLIAVVLFCAPLASKIPLAILAALLIKVGIDIIDYKFLKLLPNAPKSDLIVMITVFMLTVFYDLIFAVGVGVVLSSLLFAVNVAKLFKIEVTDTRPSDKRESAESDLGKNTFIIRIDGIFFFGSAVAALSRIDGLLGTKTVIIDCHSINILDISATFALEKMIATLKDKNINVILVLNNPKIASKQLRLGLREYLSRSEIAFSLEKAIIKAKRFDSL